MLQGSFEVHGPCNEQRHPELDQVAESHIQPDVECVMVVGERRWLWCLPHRADVVAQYFWGEMGYQFSKFNVTHCGYKAARFFSKVCY